MEQGARRDGARGRENQGITLAGVSIMYYGDQDSDRYSVKFVGDRLNLQSVVGCLCALCVYEAQVCSCRTKICGL